MTVFVDTWGWLALEDRRDPSHLRVKALYKRLAGEGVRRVTTDFVLDETITRLFQRRPFLESKRFVEATFAAAELGHLRIERVDAALFQQAWLLRLRFDDQPGISFTDLASFAVMKTLGVTRVITQDRHFGLGGFTLLP